MLPYSLAAYFSTVARMNAELWWAAMILVTIVALLALTAASGRGGPAQRITGLALAATWLTSGWLFYGTYMEPLFFAAPWFAWAYTAQAGLLALIALAPDQRLEARTGPGLWLGLVVMGLALAGVPALETLLRGGWPAIRVVGLSPEPTLMLTCGWLLTRRLGIWTAALAVIPLAGGGAAAYSAVALAWQPDWLVTTAAALLLIAPALERRARSTE